jgi:CheY-like chemotaxis protein
MILVLDDNQQYIRSWRRVFGSWGWDDAVLFDSPATVAEAVDIIGRVQPEILCLDMNFSEDMLEEGVAVARVVAERWPHITILAISTDRTGQRKRYAGNPCVRHFPGKSPFEMRKCIDGTCACANAVAA